MLQGDFMDANELKREFLNVKYYLKRLLPIILI